jgi:hypothetical protein
MLLLQRVSVECGIRIEVCYYLCESLFFFLYVLSTQLEVQAEEDEDVVPCTVVCNKGTRILYSKSTVPNANQKVQGDDYVEKIKTKDLRL